MEELGKEFKKVKPKMGLTVRYPRTYAILPGNGGVVPWIGADGRYWRRRVRCGDVQIIKQEMDGISKQLFKKK